MCIPINSVFNLILIGHHLSFGIAFIIVTVRELGVYVAVRLYGIHVTRSHDAARVDVLLGFV